ncbi:MULTISPECIES: hypothetical protein [unclassified Bartonella]|uniref:hypothetical protein n=1 Tax=unclassified Bartonella TaxID=2645622 RepID=UPI0035D0D12E
MSNDLFFLLLLVFSYLFIVVVIGTYKVSKRFDIPWWRAAFYCIFGVSLFLKEVLFYGVLGVVLFLALLGMESMDIPWGLLSLMGIVFAALLEWFLILHMRGRRDGVVTRCLWLLKGVVFCAVVGATFFCFRLGAENLGLSWLWFAKDWVFFIICGFILPVVSVGARRARLKAEAFLKRVGFMGYYR